MSAEYKRYEEFSKDWNYNSMAEKYDEEIEQVKCRAIDLISYFMLTFLVDKTVRILDIAAGTGLCGKNLKSLGYSNIDALEPAENMLAKAREKAIYLNYFNEGVHEDKPTTLPEKAYDVVISAGAFALEGHIQAGGLNEFIRVVKPDGMIFITFRYEFMEIYKEFARKFNQLIRDHENNGILKVLVNCVVPEYIKGKEGIVLVFKRLN